MDIEGHGVFRGCAHNGDQYPYILHREVARDPVARLFGRVSTLETGGVVKTRCGREVRMDAENMRILTGRGNTAVSESGLAMRVAMNIHAAVHFTHGFATDGSKGKGGATAWSAWSGADMLAHGAQDVAGEQMLHATQEQEERAAGEGIEGGRLPAEWEVIDAEMYAVFRSLLRVYLEARREGGEGHARTCKALILMDCKSALEQLEKAWRRGEIMHEKKGPRRGLVEAVCRLRAKLGLCVLCYVPAHVGCSPNEYADAGAKSHLGDDEMEDAAMAPTISPVSTRACMYSARMSYLNFHALH